MRTGSLPNFAVTAIVLTGSSAIAFSKSASTFSPGAALPFPWSRRRRKSRVDEGGARNPESAAVIARPMVVESPQPARRQSGNPIFGGSDRLPAQDRTRRLGTALDRSGSALTARAAFGHPGGSVSASVASKGSRISWSIGQVRFLERGQGLPDLGLVHAINQGQDRV